MCSTIYSGNAYLDKIDLRLKEINDIPFQDQLYLYQAVLEGFKVLNEKFGYFTITEEMIFITKEGKVRVWMNPNPSRNTPYSHDPLGCNLDKKMSMQPRRTHGSQSQMLSCLIQLVEENTDQQLMSRYNYFSRYLLERNLLERLSFYKAVEEFDKYCKENSFIVPECMSSIVDIFQEGIEGPTSSYLLRSSVDNRFPKTNHQEHNDGERLRFSKASSYDGPQLNIESRHEFGDKNGYQFNIGQRPAK